jgi:hypothetical protein
VRHGRITLAFAIVLLVVGTTTEGFGACPASAPVDFPRVCAGQSSAAVAPICFGDACGGTGTIVGVVAPSAPFAVTGLHIDGPAGSRVVTELDFPLALAAGESLVADLSVGVDLEGLTQGQLAWMVQDEPAPCPVDLRALTCVSPTPENACLGESCVEGTCVAAPITGSCEDGDLCTLDDTCVDGVCQPGTPMDCSAEPCMVDAACAKGVCVGTPVDCADLDPCTDDACDPLLGCVHAPASGAVCDDGDACTTDDVCLEGACAGQPMQCPPDAIACTADRCVDGVCQHQPKNARCGRDQCVIGECLPGDRRADRRGCVAVPVRAGQACTDDGFSCTDDVCAARGCLHVPIDSRCEEPDTCTIATCAPDRPDADAAGCAFGLPPDDDGEGTLVATEPLVEGAKCAEDGDPCTRDVCRQTRCAHEPATDLAICAPAAPVFRTTLGLTEFTRSIVADVAEAAPVSQPLPPALTDPLERIELALESARRILAGEGEASTTVRPLAAMTLETAPAHMRARIAFTQIRRTPREARNFLETLTTARTRAALGPQAARELRRRGRVLLRGIKALKIELRRLRSTA